MSTMIEMNAARFLSVLIEANDWMTSAAIQRSLSKSNCRQEIDRLRHLELIEQTTVPHASLPLHFAYRIPPDKLDEAKLEVGRVFAKG